MRGFLIFLALLAVLVVGGVVVLGFSRDWFSLAVNQEKIKEDTDEAKDKLHDLGQQIKDKAGKTTDKTETKTGTQAAGAKTVSGKVKKLEVADNRFLMTTADNGELTVYTDPSSTLQRDDQPVGLADLRVGDRVEVNYVVKDGKDLATSVTARRD